MARTPFTGVPDVAPRTSVPDDYQRIQPEIGGALQQFGEGASRAAQFFGQAAADNAFNQFQDGVTKILNGDPNKTVIGPDGQPTQDTGYLGMKGQQALNGRPQAQKQMDDLLTNIRSGLQTPEQQLQFDTYSRRYRASAMERIGSHSDQQANVWYGEVNSATEKNAIDHIANNVTNPKEVAAGAADLINARVKQAQLAGAQPGDPVYQQAVESGKRDALKVQVTTLAGTDPAAALRILNKNKNIAGIDYEPLQKALQSKADTADGQAVGAAAIKGAIDGHVVSHPYSTPSAPIYQQAVQAVPGGYSPAGLARTIQIESHGNPNAANASGHVGLGQFSESTWAQYGHGDRRDPEQSILAIQRYAVANQKYLSGVLGRPATDAELYLAHQQGPAGAAALLAHPNMSVVDALTPIYHGNREAAAKAVQGNGGNVNMTAGQFASMWTHKFNGTTATGGPFVQGPPAPANLAHLAPEPDIPTMGTADIGQMPQVPGTNEAPAAPAPPPVAAPDLNQPNRMQDEASPRAAAYKAVLDNDTLSAAVKAHAISYLNEQFKAMKIAEDADTQARKEANDQAAGGYMRRILNGNVANITDEIANDPHLEWGTKESLTNAAEKHMQDTAGGQVIHYGPGFWKAYQQVTAEPGNPSRISDVNAILRRAGPGGDLTLPGAEKLISIMKDGQKSYDGQAINETKAAMLKYAHSKISFDTSGIPPIPGEPVKHDAQGEMLFNSRFVPKFEAAYDQWTKEGKNPWDFLTQDNIDKMLQGIRSPKEMAMARLQAQETGMDASQMQAPPAPADVDPEGWKLIMNAPPKVGDNPVPEDRWQAIVQKLRTDPSPATKKWFDFHFGPSGIKADDVLDVLSPQKAQGK